MRVKGLEPIRRKAPDPKSGLSTNSNTPAWSAKVRICFDSAKWPMQKTAPERELQKGRLREERGGGLEAVPVELAGTYYNSFPIGISILALHSPFYTGTQSILSK